VTYASQTSVSVERSRAEIERTLIRYGASKFVYGWDREEAVIAFVVHNEATDEFRQVRFKVHVPSREDFLRTPTGKRRTATQVEKEWEQAQRQRWRALLLVIKAKLEAIEAGIATFEDEFLAYTMLPSGVTVGEWMHPQLAEAYKDGIMPSSLKLALPAGKD
jgi:hypothetical protein